MEPANFKGVQGEVVTWPEVLRVKALRGNMWKPFYNQRLNGAKILGRLGQGPAAGYYEAVLTNSRGLNTMRLIVDSAYRARAVISHTIGLGNEFVEATTIALPQLAAAAGGGAAAQQQAAAAVEEAVVAGEDAALVGEVAAGAAADAGAMGVAAEVAEVVALALLIV
jgi:hypothetical protein